MMTAIERAVEIAGGQKALGDLIGESKSFVNQLVKGRRPVPLNCCPKIEAATGVTCEELRPDVEWIRADGVITGYTVAVAAAA